MNPEQKRQEPFDVHTFREQTEFLPAELGRCLRALCDSLNDLPYENHPRFERLLTSLLAECRSLTTGAAQLAEAAERSLGREQNEREVILAQSARIEQLEAALEKNRTIAQVVHGEPEGRGRFFDPSLHYTSSNSEVLSSCLKRIEAKDISVQMTAYTDFSKLARYIAFDVSKSNEFLPIFNAAAEAILTGENPGLANHAAAVFMAYPEAMRLFVNEFEAYLEHKTAATFNHITERTIKEALRSLR